MRISLYQRAQKHMMPSWEGLRWLSTGGRWFVLLGFALFLGIPLYWLVIAPSKLDDELIALPTLAWGSLQNVGIAWQHLYRFNNGTIVGWTINSLGYAAGSIVISIACNILAGYSLATMQYRGRKLILIVTLIAMIMPSATTVVPLFLQASWVGLIDTIWSVIIPGAFFPSGVYFIYIFYVTSLPKELLAAGRIDGCTEFQLFYYIGMPLAKPIIGLVAFFTFVASWNNFFLPFVMLFDDTKFPLSIGLTVLSSSSSAFNSSSGFVLSVRRPELLLASLITVIPVVLIFIISQRVVVRSAGGMGGAEKG